jgi:hypothetical protein
MSEGRINRLKEYENQRSIGSATKANIYNWTRRASKHSPQHGMHDGGGCCTPEKDQDLPKTPSTGRVKTFRT